MWNLESRRLEVRDACSINMSLRVIDSHQFCSATKALAAIPALLENLHSEASCALDQFPEPVPPISIPFLMSGKMFSITGVERGNGPRGSGKLKSRFHRIVGLMPSQESVATGIENV